MNTDQYAADGRMTGVESVETMLPSSYLHSSSLSEFDPNPSVTSVSSVTALLPLPMLPIHVRVGTRDDIGFIDALQKQHGKALGFFPRAQLEGYIDSAWVLVAEMNGLPVGYVASRDRYLKRDELGVIYQLCVSPSVQRGLIGASLIQAVFERSAYGCRLYCCWCAQDLAANCFWEALGFQAIAFRGGSAKRGKHGSARVHIFWQKRIRANDHATPWWFPAKTDGGAIRENRLVLPIPPGLHWSDEMPTLLPEASTSLPDANKEELKPARRKTFVPLNQAQALPPTPKARFGPPGTMPVTPADATTATQTEENPVAPKRKKVACDLKHVAIARELRDRYLERVNAEPIAAVSGKYEVRRPMAADVTVEADVPSLSRNGVRLLPAA